MPASRQINSVFTQVNAVGAAHALPDGELQTATNIDFSLGQGVLLPRRGCQVLGTVVAGTAVNQLFKLYNGDNPFTNAFYALGSNGTIYRSTDGVTWTGILTGGSSEQRFGFTSFGTYAYIANGTQFIKDDGTNVTDWIKQSPQQPTIVVNTLAPLSFGTGSFNVSEGTLVSGTSTATAATDATTVRVSFTMILNGTSGVDLTTNAGHLIGQFGVHFIDLAFDNPSNVARISQDWSIGDATFYNYFHQDLFPQNAIVPFVDGQPVSASGQADPNTLIDAQLNLGTTTEPLDQATRDAMVAAIRVNNQSSLAVVSQINNVLAPWAVARPDLSLVGTYVTSSGVDPWSSIFAVRYTIECSALTTATIRNPQIWGSVDFPLSDVSVGYTWWQTWATLDSSANLIGESAPSPASTQYTMQNANVTVSQTGTATGSHGITHMITYRQGGFLNDAYAVSTVALATATITDTVNDIQALSIADILNRDVLRQNQMPGAIETISEIFQNRIFIAPGGPTIRWSLPGKADSFPLDSIAQVSSEGDLVTNIVAWPPGLIIINQYSVYEMTGNNFEEGDWQLVRSGSRHGATASRVSGVKTPYGVPLLNYDGLTMYLPGQGIDQEIQWLDTKYGDMFKGGGPQDPAVLKGNRIPAISRNVIDECSAAYSDHKLYISAANGTSTNLNTVYVIDFARQQCWWYIYPFSIKDLFWDTFLNRLLAVTDDGRLMQLENGQGDGNTSGTATSFVWTALTKKYSTPNDTLMEHAYLDCTAPGGITVAAHYDGTSTAIATLSNATRQWQYAPLNGKFSNNIEFLFTGTSTGTASNPVLYQMNFDVMEEPPQTLYWRTDYELQGSPDDKIWDVANFDFALRRSTGTVTAVTFVDNVAIMTNFLVGTNLGRTMTLAAFPNETYGRVAYTTYTSSVLFQHWETNYTSRVEPPLIANFVTPKLSGPEHEWKVFIPELDCMGSTVVATCYVDDVATATFTITGTGRLQYTFSMPIRTFGRTVWATYNSSGVFKRYPPEEPKLEFEGYPEPSRVTTWRTGPNPYPSSQFLKTWLPHLDPRTGTVTGTLIVDDNVLTTATFTGDRQQWFTVGLDLNASNVVETGSRWEAVYSRNDGDKFKHYETKMETEAKPFGKPVWAYIYHKQGGVSQIDMPRFFSVEAEALGTVTCTYFVDIDTAQFATGSFVLTGGIQWLDRISLPPGGRGRIFEFRLQCNGNNVKVYKVNLDMMQEGVKNLVRRETQGTPPQQLSVT